MGKYQISIGGIEYEVEAPDVETATKDLNAYRQTEMNQKLETEGKEAPEWVKPFMALNDVARVGVDTLTGGYGDKVISKLSGKEEGMITEATKNRMGWAAPALEAGLFARFLPSLIPKVAATMGGGPAAKAIVSGTTAAGEGAGYGMLSASGHDKDVGEGGVIGAAGGMLGNAVGNVVNRGVKAFKGVDDIPPATRITVLPKGRAPTRKELVEATVNKARTDAKLSDDPLAEQKKLRTAFEKLATGRDKTLLTPAQREFLPKIYAGDPATKASRVMGDFLSNKLLSSGLGVGIGAASGDILSGLATTGLTLTGGKLLKKVSAGGTEEAVQGLRRWVHNQPKFVGPISAEEKARIAAMVRQGMLSQQE